MKVHLILDLGVNTSTDHTKLKRVIGSKWIDIGNSHLPYNKEYSVLFKDPHGHKLLFEDCLIQVHDIETVFDGNEHHYQVSCYSYKTINHDEFEARHDSIISEFIHDLKIIDFDITFQ